MSIQICPFQDSTTCAAVNIFCTNENLLSDNQDSHPCFIVRSMNKKKSLTSNLKKLLVRLVCHLASCSVQVLSYFSDSDLILTLRTLLKVIRLKPSDHTPFRHKFGYIISVRIYQSLKSTHGTSELFMNYLSDNIAHIITPHPKMAFP